MQIPHITVHCGTIAGDDRGGLGTQDGITMALFAGLSPWQSPLLSALQDMGRIPLLSVVPPISPTTQLTTAGTRREFQKAVPSPCVAIINHLDCGSSSTGITKSLEVGHP